LREHGEGSFRRDVEAQLDGGHEVSATRRARPRRAIVRIRIVLDLR
jgi:hypothetical protein